MFRAICLHAGTQKINNPKILWSSFIFDLFFIFQFVRMDFLIASFLVTTLHTHASRVMDCVTITSIVWMDLMSRNAVSWYYSFIFFISLNNHNAYYFAPVMVFR